jgi:hypothetical protein
MVCLKKEGGCSCLSDVTITTKEQASRMFAKRGFPEACPRSLVTKMYEVEYTDKSETEPTAPQDAQED